MKLIYLMSSQQIFVKQVDFASLCYLSSDVYMREQTKTILLKTNPAANEGAFT